jgi:NDP-sugar pyrophosphorylase family protein
MRPLTVHTPKPIAPIANRPFLLYQLDLLAGTGITDIILCLSYQPRKIEDVLGDGGDYGFRIKYIVEASPLGTAGALKNCEGLIEGTTIVFNGDILTDLDLKPVIEQHRATEAAATIVLTPVEHPSEYGVVETHDNRRVKRFVEKPTANQVAAHTINAGMYILEPSVLQHISSGKSCSFEYDLFPALLEKSAPFYAYTASSYWRDIGTPESYHRANLDVLAGKLRTYPLERPARGEKFDESARLDDLSLVHPTCTIKAGAEIINSIIGPNCFIEERARIEDSVLWSANRISAQADIKGSVIGKSCHIGRSVIISTGTFLGDKSVLTDFSLLAASRLN